MEINTTNTYISQLILEVNRTGSLCGYNSKQIEGIPVMDVHMSLFGGDLIQIKDFILLILICIYKPPPVRYNVIIILINN